MNQLSRTFRRTYDIVYIWLPRLSRGATKVGRDTRVLLYYLSRYKHDKYYEIPNAIIPYRIIRLSIRD